MLDQMSDVWRSLSASYEGMGGQILGAMTENLAPCLSLRKFEFLGSGVDWGIKKKALRFTSECFQYIQIN